LSEEDQTVTALFTLAIDLAPTAPDLTRWGREHTALIDAQPDPVFHAIRAAYADRLAVLKERQ
jgi:hypothetical protein